MLVFRTKIADFCGAGKTRSVSDRLIEGIHHRVELLVLHEVDVACVEVSHEAEKKAPVLMMAGTIGTKGQAATYGQIAGLEVVLSKERLREELQSGRMIGIEQSSSIKNKHLGFSFHDSLFFGPIVLKCKRQNKRWHCESDQELL